MNYLKRKTFFSHCNGNKKKRIPFFLQDCLKIIEQVFPVNPVGFLSYSNSFKVMLIGKTDKDQIHSTKTLTSKPYFKRDCHSPQAR